MKITTWTLIELFYFAVYHNLLCNDGTKVLWFINLICKKQVLEPSIWIKNFLSSQRLSRYLNQPLPPRKLSNLSRTIGLFVDSFTCSRFDARVACLKISYSFMYILYTHIKNNTFWAFYQEQLIALRWTILFYAHNTGHITWSYNTAL